MAVFKTCKNFKAITLAMWYYLFNVVYFLNKPKSFLSTVLQTLSLSDSQPQLLPRHLQCECERSTPWASTLAILPGQFPFWQLASGPFISFWTIPTWKTAAHENCPGQLFYKENSELSVFRVRIIRGGNCLPGVVVRRKLSMWELSGTGLFLNHCRPHLIHQKDIHASSDKPSLSV